MPDSLTIIRAEIAKGHVVRARKILRMLLEETPTAPLWFLASTICETPDQELGCLRQTLKIDPHHLQARERYIELKKAQRQEMMPPLMVLVDDLPDPVENANRTDPFTAKYTRDRRSRRRWTAVGLSASLVMSVSSAYFMLTVLGSPIPAQIRAIVSGQSGNDQSGRPIFGSQSQGSGQLNTPSAPVPPVSATNENYSAEAAAGGFVVHPNKSEDLQAEKPVNDVLDPGFAHEYVINAKQGDEIAVAVQFFSPTAHKVAANMAMLDPDGFNAASVCERGSILTDGSSVTYMCKINKTGDWKLQLFGHSGESTGVYIVTYQRMS